MEKKHVFLIADAGATKTDWAVVVNGKTPRILNLKSGGINPVLHSVFKIREVINDMVRKVPLEFNVNKIFFYGAGCRDCHENRVIEKCLEEAFPNARLIEIKSDLLGASRALFEDFPGIACILGTGSNSCVYLDEQIKEHTPPLGFILGDEGSGAALGKRLISDIYKKLVPEKITQLFLNEYSYTLSDIIEKTYRSDYPSAFLASFVPFISQNITLPYMHNLVTEEFARFFHRNLNNYGQPELKLGFIGSVALVFENILREVAESLGKQISRIEGTPMPGLIQYHLKNFNKFAT